MITMFVALLIAMFAAGALLIAALVLSYVVDTTGRLNVPADYFARMDLIDAFESMDRADAVTVADKVRV